MSIANRPTISELAKAVVMVLDENDEPAYSIPVLFNPTEYDLDTRIQYGEQSLPGLTTPVTQFVSGESETLSMELFVDASDRGIDVRLYTGRIDELLAVDEETHAPPRVRFIWGSLNFKSVLESVSKRFTMFLPGGFPVRARLDVTFRRYETPAWQRAERRRESADRTKVRRVTESDTLPLIASEEYGDPGQWRPIADANGIENPRSLEIGRELVVPPLEPE